MGPDLPTTMTAAVFDGPGVIELEDRPVPTPGPGEVLVEVSHCGVCGSDLHLGLDGWARPGSIGGHEFTGRIVAVGEGVEGWPAGLAVLGGPEPRCGSCRWCRAARPSLCEARANPGRSDHQGAFTRYVRVDARRLLRVPDGLGLRVAALAEPLAVALHAITVGRIAPPDRVMITGLGPIGQLVLAVLVTRGHGDVTVVEPLPRRQQLAQALGAGRILEPSALALFSIAEPERLAADPVDVVVECSGRRAAMEAGLCQLARGGRLVLVGAGIEPPSFDPNRILLNELVVTGAFNYDHGGFEQALELLASGALPVDRLIEPVDVPLDRLLDAMHALVRGDLAAKVMVVPFTESQREEASHG
ncbi:zinc-dependent alcohol dehydrogenase [Rhabdothermincola sp.]|mgnify:CR=1 FL=1|uniref:zinc-dependent alcohol dehydrogenase n=1 Tax=Rhabdothermincola sp. TaxID=2820405 RepID=UPI002FDFE488